MLYFPNLCKVVGILFWIIACFVLSDDFIIAQCLKCNNECRERQIFGKNKTGGGQFCIKYETPSCLYCTGSGGCCILPDTYPVSCKEDNSGVYKYRDSSTCTIQCPNPVNDKFYEAYFGGEDKFETDENLHPWRCKESGS